MNGGGCERIELADGAGVGQTVERGGPMGNAPGLAEAVDGLPILDGFRMPIELLENLSPDEQRRVVVGRQLIRRVGIDQGGFDLAILQAPGGPLKAACR